MNAVIKQAIITLLQAAIAELEQSNGQVATLKGQIAQHSQVIADLHALRGSAGSHDAAGAQAAAAAAIKVAEGHDSSAIEKLKADALELIAKVEGETVDESAAEPAKLKADAPIAAAVTAAVTAATEQPAEEAQEAQEAQPEAGATPAV